MVQLDRPFKIVVAIFGCLFITCLHPIGEQTFVLAFQPPSSLTTTTPTATSPSTLLLLLLPPLRRRRIPVQQQSSLQRRTIQPTATNEGRKSGMTGGSGGGAVALAPYASEAASLFNNMKLPATILAGALVPLGLLSPLPIRKPSSDGEAEESTGRKVLRYVQYYTRGGWGNSFAGGSLLMKLLLPVLCR
jgi:hypothetical protein